MATQGDQLGLAIKNPLRFKEEAIKRFEVLYKIIRIIVNAYLVFISVKIIKNTRRFKFKIIMYFVIEILLRYFSTITPQQTISHCIYIYKTVNCL